MKFKIRGVHLRGVQLVLPSNEVRFDDEIGDYNFSPEQSAKLKQFMGYNKRRVVKGDVTSSDLIVRGFESIREKSSLDLDTIDALIVVTQTPDYLIPPTSYIVHNRMSFKQDMLCIDINQGCAGFVVGLCVASSLLSQSGLRRVALVNVDVLSRLVAPSDRNSRPIVGDAAAITILDATEDAAEVPVRLKVDGGGWDSLMIPSGGMKLRPSPETARFVEDSFGNLRSSDNLVMRGDAVFNFVMREVPPLIRDLIDDAGVHLDDVDAFVFHQPNPFMLRKLAEKIGALAGKMPMDLVPRFGNSSGVSIPAVLASSFQTKFFDTERLVCFAGFGVGLTWAAVLMPIHKVSFLDTVET